MPTRRPRELPSDEEPDDVPLHYKQAFGSGIKRKRVEFVKAQDPVDSTTNVTVKAQNASAISDLYASIVMGSPAEESKTASHTPTAPDSLKTRDEGAEDAQNVCEVCKIPIGSSLAAHEATLAHQVSLRHSHPPSHLDRKRMGLKALKSQGWDPDARIGLGREGEGRRFPIKAAAKEDTLGIGATLPEAKAKEEKERVLGAKEVRQQVERERRRGEKLSREVYGRTDVEAYLRGDTGGGDGLK